MTEQFNSNENQPKENLEDIISRCKADIEKIAQFSGGLETLYQQTQEKHKKLEDALKAATKVDKELNEFHVATVERTGKVAGAQGQLETDISGAQETLKNLEAVLVKTQEVQTAATAAKQSVDTDVQSITDAKGRFITLEAETQGQANSLNQRQTDLQGKIKTIEDDHVRISDMAKKIFDDEKDTEGKTTKAALQTKINSLYSNSEKKLEEITKNSEAQKEEFSELKKSLTAEIHQLLPGAAAAGLASAYREAKLRYGKDDAVNASSQEIKLPFWKTKIETSFWHYCLFMPVQQNVFPF